VGDHYKEKYVVFWIFFRSHKQDSPMRNTAAFIFLFIAWHGRCTHAM